MDKTTPNDDISRGFTTNVTAGYYHVPPLWIGEDPFKEGRSPDDHEIHIEVIRRSCKNGIEIRVCRDGLFIFDFTKWNPGASVTIPSYKREPGKRVPPNVLAAHDKAGQAIYRRVEVMNSHLACLNTAIALRGKLALPIGQEISPSDCLVPIRVSSGEWGLELNPFWPPMHAYVAKHWGSSRSSTRPRTVIEVSIVQASFDMLDKLMASPLQDSMMLAALLLRSAKSYGEHDFSGSLIVSWMVLEKLVSVLWSNLIEKNRRRGKPQDDTIFINGERKTKLEGRDYSASVRVEILSLMAEIDLEMYSNLNEIRKSRNDWMHELEAANDKAATLAIRTAQQLFEDLTGIRLSPTLSYSLSY